VPVRADALVHTLIGCAKHDFIFTPSAVRNLNRAAVLDLR
jgi:hypothetical protein